MTPFDVGAYASSTTYLSGEAVLDARAEGPEADPGRRGRDAGQEAGRPGRRADAKVVAKDGSGSVTYSEVALHSLYAANQFQIAAISSHITPQVPAAVLRALRGGGGGHGDRQGDAWSSTWRPSDCGTAINPKLAEGQTEGGVLNGISYALTEEYLFNAKGKMLNDSFLHYRIFSMRDKPELEDDPGAELREDRPVRREERVRNLHQRPVPGHRQRDLQRRRRPPARSAVHAGEGVAGDQGTDERRTLNSQLRTSAFDVKRSMFGVQNLSTVIEYFGNVY